MNFKRFTLLALIFLPLALFAQKKPLTHDDYDAWKSLRQQSITNDGEWIKYEINPQEGDGNLYLYNVKKLTLENFERGFSSDFSAENDFFAFLIKPEFDVTRQAKKDKKKPDEMPKNNLGIKLLPDGELLTVERVKSFKVFEGKGAWIAYLMEKPQPKKKEKKEGKETVSSEEAKPQTTRGGSRNGAKADGTELVIYNPLTKASHSFKDVVDYTLGKDGENIGFVQSTTDSTKVKHFTVSLFSVSDESVTEIFKGDGDLQKLTMNDDGTKQAFMYTSDTSDVKIYSLYLNNGASATKVVDCDTPGMEEEWSVSENGISSVLRIRRTILLWYRRKTCRGTGR